MGACQISVISCESRGVLPSKSVSQAERAGCPEGGGACHGKHPIRPLRPHYVGGSANALWRRLTHPLLGPCLVALLGHPCRFQISLASLSSLEMRSGMRGQTSSAITEGCLNFNKSGPLGDLSPAGGMGSPVSPATRSLRGERGREPSGDFHAGEIHRVFSKARPL